MGFWKYVLAKIKDNQKVYVLTVIENFGSSPGRKGFKMLVAQDGFIFGSIGGGVMEFTLVEEVQNLLQNEDSPVFIKKQIHKGTIENGSGMICSGEQTIAFHCLDFKQISVIESILSCIQTGQNGTLNLTPNSFCFSKKQQENQFNYQINSNSDWYFNEYIGYKETLYIVGGGHVGVAVSETFVKLGFYVVVFDNRENLNTLENNNFAHKKLVVDYNDINNHIPEGKISYIAIMTNKYTDDKLVLSKLLKNDYKFIGVLGSKAKLETMWEVLRNEKHSQKELDAVYAPIGLSIKSETPEEIAISIAAQIIQLKNLNK
ncbi:XdhC family protein [Tenacibaculum sp. AHE15PA]|uniref:XdhC family protein n=1 Tax=unclassified Tenacibaculum TaxID=2635139 RepID=UPI001C4F1B35|nr:MULTISPECIES: XdhC/CoxI family protein [unclassified Tenacibaculum]QXP72394.1 XdhC family protein [Tenacibaculum sp. AHE14PA]QXP76309.1 XdhC family protein [Tenacibaculum sp. AHE15PA]